MPANADNRHTKRLNEIRLRLLETSGRAKKYATRVSGTSFCSLLLKLRSFSESDGASISFTYVCMYVCSIMAMHRLTWVWAVTER